ncbi:unnamed protein product (macronuclear) [Paramecium tetraurelia]|uniref:Uncharacterized protein n=1 Tax=Paramecium tetraurelia TaxID=5888 RepID=A0BUT0_PARTE|nr:uncharacterized protein GSPATT00005543001 [Paramecium tetraurelia]CAK62297.1 unnamed protein product [Paramecium tetraurelia]|eukprot:XP_001429695.1 hypothetical protein (macronuclear) [Paramecium tetraurelia strain d4-2]
MIEDQYLLMLKQNSISPQIIEAYLQQKQHLINNVISYFANIITYGPIALFNAEKICSSKQSQQFVSTIRKNYETMFGLNDQQDSQSFIENSQEYFKQYFSQQIFDQHYLSFLNDLKECSYVKQLSRNQWLDQLQDIIEISTIQEINQTQIINEQFESDTLARERKSICYDGDEERTPQQSEEDEQNKNKYQKNKKEKELQNGEGGEEGYDASNSDHKTKISKLPRRIIQRRKQANNQEFDTDREYKQKE